MKEIEAPTFTVRLYMSGDVAQAKATLRRLVMPPGPASRCCVTVEPTTYIYPGGEEQGFVIGFVNYPRFPEPEDYLWDVAREVALTLIADLCQWSALLVAPTKTLWLTARPDAQR